VQREKRDFRSVIIYINFFSTLSSTSFGFFDEEGSREKAGGSVAHSAKTEIIFNSIAHSQLEGGVVFSKVYLRKKKGTDCVDLLHLLCHRLSAFECAVRLQ
jgi:hypothetical protein